MANETKQEAVKAEAPKVQLDMGELQKLIATAVGAASGSNSEAQMQLMMSMLTELKKPYVDPNQKAIDEQFRQTALENEAKKQANVKAAQDSCQHFEGSHPLSEDTGTKSSIVKHVLDSGHMVGICTNCQKIWDPTTPGYAVEMNRKSRNRLSKSGSRYATPVAAVAS